MTSERERQLARVLDAKRRKDPKRIAYMRAYLKAYYAKTSEKQKSHFKQYYQKNKALYVRRAREWEKKNPDKKKLSRLKSAKRDQARAKKWVVDNKERHLASREKYYESHYAEFLSRNHVRRALQRKAAVNLKGIKSWMKAVKSKPSSICYYCQGAIKGSDIHFDHIVPIAKGGPHSIDNLCVSCQSCNNKKHTKSVQAFVKVGQQLLSL